MALRLPRLYVIWEAAQVPCTVSEGARMLADAGVQIVQYRNKKAGAREAFAVCRELADCFRTAGITFIVNDRADVAALCGAAGVHVGQEDLDVEDARAVLGADRRVGISTHTAEQVRRAAESSADYVAVGPVFATATKANPDPLVGIGLIREARRLTRKPLVAIGGITLETAREVVDAGADSLAVIADIWRAPDARRRIREYQDLLGAGAAG